MNVKSNQQSQWAPPADKQYQPARRLYGLSLMGTAFLMTCQVNDEYLVDLPPLLVFPVSMAAMLVGLFIVVVGMRGYHQRRKWWLISAAGLGIAGAVFGFMRNPMYERTPWPHEVQICGAFRDGATKVRAAVEATQQIEKEQRSASTYQKLSDAFRAAADGMQESIDQVMYKFLARILLAQAEAYVKVHIDAADAYARKAESKRTHDKAAAAAVEEQLDDVYRRSDAVLSDLSSACARTLEE